MIPSTKSIGLLIAFFNFLITACYGRGYCVFPRFLWQQQYALTADSITPESREGDDEKRWIEKIVLGSPIDVPDADDGSFRESSPRGGEEQRRRSATAATATVWETQSDVTAHRTELIVEQKVRTVCSGGGTGGGQTSGVGGRVACYRRDSMLSIICLAEEPMGKFRILETDKQGNSMFSCVQFVRRNDNAIQVYRAVSRQINEDRLCYDESLRRDSWVWTAASNSQWSPCSFQGGFDFVTMPVDSDQRLCPDAWRPSRLESECIQGDGLNFNFPQSDCSPFQTIANEPLPLTDRYQCLAAWDEDAFRYIVFGSASRSNHRYVMRMPSIIDSMDELNVSLFLGPVAPLNTTLWSYSSSLVAAFHLKMLRSEPGVCFDESAACRQFAREGRCTSTSAHQYANYCKHSCGLCEFAPSPKAECTFANELAGNWVMYSGVDHEEVSIEGGEVRFSTLGRFTCKSKHWEEDYYKVFSVFSNGCRPRYSCLRLSRSDGNTLSFSISPSDLTDRSFDLCEFNEDPIASTNKLRGWRPKVLVPMGNLLHAGCGINGHLAADFEFANGVTCSNGFVSDVNFRPRNQRCEPKPSLTVALPLSCNPIWNKHRPTDAATLEYRCIAVVRLSDNISFLVSQPFNSNITSSSTSSNSLQYTCWLLRDLIDERRRLITEVNRARCDTAHAIVLPRTATELVTMRLYKGVDNNVPCSAPVAKPTSSVHLTGVWSNSAAATSLSTTRPVNRVAVSSKQLPSSGSLDRGTQSSRKVGNRPKPAPSEQQSDTVYDRADGNEDDGSASSNDITSGSSSSLLIQPHASSPNSRIRKQPDKSGTVDLRTYSVARSSSSSTRALGTLNKGHVTINLVVAAAASLHLFKYLYWTWRVWRDSWISH